MNDYYGALKGDGPLKSRGLETRQITKTVNQPELNEKIVGVIKSYPQRFKEFIFPVESVIHRFAIEVMRAVQSAYIIAAGGNDKEVARLQALVGKAIDTIKGSGNEKAMEIIKAQLEKLSKVEDDGSFGDVDLSMISSAAEGIVFDYDGHTYKFTGGFAPANQILGLFKYGRKGIPAMAEEGDLTEEILRFLTEQEGKKVVVVYPGRFQPMGRHHAATYAALTNKFGADNVYVATSNVVKAPNSPLNFEQKKDIMIKHGIPANKIVQTRNPYQAQELLDNFDPNTTAVVFAVGKKDMQESPRFANLGGVRKDGKPAYFRKFEGADDLAGFSEHGYVTVAPHVSINVPGIGEMSGTALRKVLSTADEKTFEQVMGWFDPNTYAMLQNTLQEVGMASGAVAIGPGRAPDVVGSEKKKKRHPKDFLKERDDDAMSGNTAVAYPYWAETDEDQNKARIEDDENDQLVNEVTDYLLGIMVG